MKQSVRKTQVQSGGFRANQNINLDWSKLLCNQLVMSVEKYMDAH